jgi:uncharacterized membrane protein
MLGAREWQIGFAATLLVSVGCTRDPPQPQLPPPSAEPSIASAPTEPPLAAESSLAIKRGMMTLTEERTTFRPCEGKAEWWVLDQSPGLITQTLIEHAQAAPLALYVEAYGERAPANEDPEAKGFEGIFVLEEVLYAGVPGDERGCAAPDAAYIVTARGNEPFWFVEVGDERMLWRQPEAPKEIVFGPAQTEDAEGAVRYSASTTEHQVELLIHAQPCRDSMSGEYFAYTSKAILNGKEFSGCARVGR